MSGFRPVVVLALMMVPAIAAAQGRGRPNAQGIPPGHVPRPGECRVWYEGRPPGQQPPPTDCRTAERVARESRYARVIYGDDYRDDRGNRRDDRDWRTDDRYQRRDPYPDYPERRRPDAYRNHPGWESGYRDGVVKGREDARKNRSYDPRRHAWYRSASRGYDRRYGLRGEYATIYREGFEAGYAQEFGRDARRMW